MSESLTYGQFADLLNKNFDELVFRKLEFRFNQAANVIAIYIHIEYIATLFSFKEYPPLPYSETWQKYLYQLYEHMLKNKHLYYIWVL